MARPAKPWWREQTRWWMVKISGKQTKLIEGPKDENHRLMAEEKFAELRKLNRTSPQSASARTADVIDAYLVWSRDNLAPDTHRINIYYLQLFAEACGEKSARELIPYDIEMWVSGKKSAGDWGDTTVYNAKKAAFRVFSWAKQMKLIPENPLAGMPRPKPKPRQRAITDAEFWKLYEFAGGPTQDILLALYLTGARPKEIRDLLWTSVQKDRWVLPEHKTAKDTGRPRVIYLDETMRAMMERLKDNGHTHVFLNTEGTPWTMNALRLQISRLRKKLGLPEDVTAYLCRHGYGTRAILNGVDGRTLAELMGHTSQEMISKVYVHLADQHQHLKAAVNKINVTSAMPLLNGERQERKRAKPVNPKKSGRKRKKREMSSTL